MSFICLKSYLDSFHKVLIPLNFLKIGLLIRQIILAQKTT